PLALEPPVSESLHALFGYTREDLKLVIAPMARDAKEPIWSMGDDTPVSALARVPRSIYSYFRQRFAQVTNPPIDPLREDLMMSLRVRIGTRGNFIAETPDQARLLELDSPFMTDAELASLRADAELRPATLSTLFPSAAGADGLRPALEALKLAAEAAVQSGAQILILSDRGVDAEHSFIPALL